MSDKPIRLTKKQLKATAFRTRKKGKAVLEEPTPLPEADDDEHATRKAVETGPPKRKRKRDDGDVAALKPEEVDTGAQAGGAEDTLCAAAKRRKRKKAALARKFEDDKATKASKLILFVGNLPFDITADRLKSFFLEHCDETPEVRLLTPKLSENVTSGESKLPKPTKGCGFVEFKTSSALQKALRLHHTPISCEKTGNENQKKSRKINIELSAGGGGTSVSRLKKIQLSKERLNKQRDKRLEKNLKEITEKKLKYGLEASEEDITVKFGKKKKKSQVVLEENGKADWGSKTNFAIGTTKTTQKSFSTFKGGKPFASGANSIRLA